MKCIAVLLCGLSIWLQAGNTFSYFKDLFHPGDSHYEFIFTKDNQQYLLTIPLENNRWAHNPTFSLHLKKAFKEAQFEYTEQKFLCSVKLKNDDHIIAIENYKTEQPSLTWNNEEITVTRKIITIPMS